MGLLRRWFGRKYSPSWEQPIAIDETGSDASPSPSAVYTSTSTIVVYDLGALKHRLDDDVDWWADPIEELAELNRRNLLIAGLGADGFYDLDIVEEGSFGRSYSLSFPTGRIFIGAGEMLSGGGDEPDPQHGGMFVNLEPGDYTVGIKRVGAGLRIGIIRSLPFENDVTEPIHI